MPVYYVTCRSSSVLAVNFETAVEETYLSLSNKTNGYVEMRKSLSKGKKEREDIFLLFPKFSRKYLTKNVQFIFSHYTVSMRFLRHCGASHNAKSLSGMARAGAV